jgi:pyruvate dehydrogenase E2 component (dihydrolipoamide acetyltransferase)
MAGVKQPTDKSHFILPDLGEGVHEAELIKWRVKPGQTVKEHEVLAEMETDKALVEVPSPWAGTVKELRGKEGEIINVGSILVTYDVGVKAADPSSARKPAAATAKAAAPAASAASAACDVSAGVAAGVESEDAGTVVGNVSGTLSVSDRFIRKGQENNGSHVAAGKSAATPAVRRIAREMGVDINRVQGSGRGGRVTASDVEHFAGDGGTAVVQRVAPSARPAFAPVAVSGDGVSQRIPFRGVRRKIAQALSHSIHTAVHFTVVDEADVTALDKKRKEYSAVIGQKLTLLPFIMAAVCKALKKHPALNANVDDAKEEILWKSSVNLGCAVDTEHGLMVPVISTADQRSIVQLGDAVKDLAARCHNRTIAREELSGGTFTISNVGSYGGMFATPIINYPEVGILAAGRAKERVLVKNGQFYAGLVLPLSLSCDHRVVDGAEGARFLNTVVQLMENPAGLIGS